ncbi:YqjF family protein [Nocardiopsis coralliicola]
MATRTRPAGKGSRAERRPHWRAPDAVSPAPPPIPGPPFLRQIWTDVAFLHWRVEAADVAPLLPEGTRVDTLGGAAYAGLVAFRVPGSVAFGAVPTGAFGEANVRLYSVDERGRRGVVFVSMDADSAPVTAAARSLAGLPYVWSDVALHRGRNGRRAGAVRRRAPGRARASWSLQVGAELAEPGPLEHFLTARWGLHTRHLGRTWWIGVTHRPWRLHRAALLHHGGGLLAAAGITPLTQDPESVLWSPGVSSSFAPSLQ